MKRRLFSYNFTIISLSFLLLLFIDYVFFLLSKANIKGGLSVSLLILVIDLVLIGLAILVFKQMKHFMQGDMGEISVGNLLYKLKGYHHLEDVVLPEKRGNIDSVVIGPTGIWTVEVKNPTEKVVILDKFLVRDINQAFAEANGLQNLLSQQGISLPVMPVLVFANKGLRIHFGMRPVNGAYVIGKKWLEELLTKHSNGYLSPEQCLQIKETLKPFTSKFN